MITTKEIIRVKLKEYDCYMAKAMKELKMAGLVLDSIKRMCDKEDRPSED